MPPKINNLNEASSKVQIVEASPMPSTESYFEDTEDYLLYLA